MELQKLLKDVFALSDGNDVVLFNAATRRWYFTEAAGLRLYVSHLCGDLCQSVKSEQISVDEAIDFVNDVDETLARPVEKQDPRRGASITVTNRCNMRCIHCRPDSGSCGGTLSQDTVRRYLALESALGSRTLSITGGEPLMAWPLTRFAILEAHRLGMAVSLLTNGSLITPEIARFLAENKVFVQVSLDTMDTRRFSEFRGADLQHVKRGLRALLNAGVSTTISFSLTKLNALDIDGVIEYCLRNGIKSIHMAMLERGGRAGDNWTRLSLTDDEIIGFHSRLLNRYFSGLREIIPIDDYEIMLSQVQRPPSSDHCNLMCGSSALNEDGQIYGCTNLCGNGRFRIGEVTDAASVACRQAALHAELPMVNDISECSTCEVRWLCLGGCRDRVMLSNNGELSHPDPYCKVMQWLFLRMIMESARLAEKDL